MSNEPDAGNHPVSIETLRSLARTVLVAVRGLGRTEPVPMVDDRFTDVVEGLEPQALRELLQVSLPALAMEGHDELVDRIQGALDRAP